MRSRVRGVFRIWTAIPHFPFAGIVPGDRGNRVERRPVGALREAPDRLFAVAIVVLIVIDDDDLPGPRLCRVKAT
jgi:hypothetical protein